ncbi:MAG: type VI secretion system protein TssA [Candidatus Adiutrix sp.]|jgi:type VI secretion system protein VasJ|nr:type VI secretion system protein TssA [Candidatus Adiutrix sp.]
MTIELGKEPISPESPAGSDVRYEADFLALQAEIDKLSSMAGAAGGVDWRLATELGTRILAEQSKDLLAAVYLAVGRMETEGPDGLLQGLTLVGDLLETFWENMFPPLKRLRARLNALTWQQEKIAAWLEKYTGPELGREQYEAILAAAERLDRLAGEKAPEARLPNELRQLVRRLPALQAAPAPTPAVSAAGAPEPAPTPAADPEKTADPASARRLLAEAAADFVRLAAEENFSDPWRWKASRWRIWLAVEKAPPSEGGRTMLPPPPPETRGNILAHLENGRFKEAALAAEDQIAAYIFWLDLHYFCARALTGLGPEYHPAAEAVRRETLDFVAGRPGLLDLSFNDGLPLADPDTRRWLQEGRSGADGLNQPQPRQEQTAELERLIAAGETGAALAWLGKVGKEAGDGPTRLNLLLKQVELTLRAGRRGTAADLAEMALAEVDHRGLTDWDPPLARAAFLAAHKAYQAAGPEKKQPLRALTARLARLDPAAVLSLPPEDE